MKETKIEWADSTWNPVTGCLHSCEYCYARRIAERFKGGFGVGGIHDLKEPLRIAWRDSDTREVVKGRVEPYPYGFAPTFHRYRLDIPKKRWKEPSTIFVCSMADLFGQWVPVSWIASVMDACREAPQHRYLFLTKNPIRYNELDFLAILPREENFWYGTSATSNVALITMPDRPAGQINTFWSMEPLLQPVDMDAAKGTPDWVILGAETGNRKDKVRPQRGWIDSILDFCDAKGVPVFMKDSLIPIVGEDNMRRDFPWN